MVLVVAAAEVPAGEERQRRGELQAVGAVRVLVPSGRRPVRQPGSICKELHGAGGGGRDPDRDQLRRPHAAEVDEDVSLDGQHRDLAQRQVAEGEGEEPR